MSIACSVAVAFCLLAEPEPSSAETSTREAFGRALHAESVGDLPLARAELERALQAARTIADEALTTEFVLRIRFEIVQVELLQDPAPDQLDRLAVDLEALLQMTEDEPRRAAAQALLEEIERRKPKRPLPNLRSVSRGAVLVPTPVILLQGEVTPVRPSRFVIAGAATAGATALPLGSIFAGIGIGERAEQRYRAPQSGAERDATIQDMNTANRLIIVGSAVAVSLVTACIITFAVGTWRAAHR